MNRKKKTGFLLQTTKAMNLGTIFSGAGFLLYLGAAALGRRGLADGIAAVFGVIAI